jgi:hypothetical protein
MWVEFGNDNAKEGYRDPSADNPDEVLYRPLEGQRVTTITFPEGISLQEAFTTAVAQIVYHFATDGDDNQSTPAWVESDSPGLAALLAEQFGVQGKTRPKTWGAKSLGLEPETLPSAQA